MNKLLLLLIMIILLYCFVLLILNITTIYNKSNTVIIKQPKYNMLSDYGFFTIKDDNYEIKIVKNNFKSDDNNNNIISYPSGSLSTLNFYENKDDINGLISASSVSHNSRIYYAFDKKNSTRWSSDKNIDLYDLNGLYIKNENDYNDYNGAYLQISFNKPVKIRGYKFKPYNVKKWRLIGSNKSTREHNTHNTHDIIDESTTNLFLKPIFQPLRFNAIYDTYTFVCLSIYNYYNEDLSASLLNFELVI